LPRPRALSAWSRGGKVATSSGVLGAPLILANWPYTLLLIMPVNRELVSKAASEETQALLRRWGTLHAGRGALGGLATVAYLVASSAE